MEQQRNYATKKKGKTEVYPFWHMKDIKAMLDWFKDNEEWDAYLAFMLEFLMARRVGDTLSFKWSDFYYENGRMKDTVNTVEEQKTGKITAINVSDMVKEVIQLYLEKTKTDPSKNNYENYVFNTDVKTRWIERKDNKIYKIKDATIENVNLYCDVMGKDFSEKRKQQIIDAYNKKAKDYDIFGQFIYWEVEYMDVVKWQQDGFRRVFNRAAVANEITGVSTHSLRKSFGYWSRKLHPNDTLCIKTLQDIFNHSDEQTTMHYIGLSEERKHKYFDDIGDFVRNVEKGEFDGIVKNAPVVSILTEDLIDIIKEAVKITDECEIDRYTRIMKAIESKRLMDM